MPEIMPPSDEAPVVIAIVRTGGIAGRRRRWRVMPELNEATDWLTLIHQCPWDDPPVEHPGADRFVWSIRARTPEVEHQRTITDAELDGAWKQLVQAVQEATKQ